MLVCGQAIISKRNIQRHEVEELNPGVDLDRLSAGQLLKLPANRCLTQASYVCPVTLLQGMDSSCLSTQLQPPV